MAVLNGVGVNCCLKAGALTHIRSILQMALFRNGRPETAATRSKVNAVRVVAASFIRTPKGGGFLEPFL